MGIKNELMEKYGLKKEEATKLISTYARNHGGKVDLREIEKNVENISNSIIYNVGKIYRDYDVAHEILDCGKDRQRDGLMSLMDDGYDGIALGYLANNYYANVDTWVRTFYDAARHEVLEKINQDNISEYRNFVNTLPLKNIYAVASFLNIESDVVKLIAKYGDEKDFQTYMTDTRYERDGYDNETERIDRRSCPSALSKKILRMAREEIAENDTIKFNRKLMMSGLSAIYHNKNLSDEQKDELQELYIAKVLKGDIDRVFVDFVNSKVKFESPYEVIKEYLEKVDKETGWNEKEEIINKNILPIKEKEIQAVYGELLENLEEQSKSEVLTPEKFMQILRELKLNGNGMNLLKDEETGKSKLLVYVKNPIFRDENIEVEIEADRLQEIVDGINSASLDRANSELKSIAQNGIGEIQIVSNYETERRFKYSKENVLGALSEDRNSPYVVGGTSTEYGELTPLQIKYPYFTISDYMGLQDEEISMTEEQIMEFNYSGKTKADKEEKFEINGDIYHIDNIRWVSGGRYTVIWKEGDVDESNRQKAMGLSNSYSEYGSAQRGVDEMVTVTFIRQNPNRFAELYNELANVPDDKLRLYPTIHLESMCKRIMEKEQESKLIEKKESEHTKSPEENYVDKIVEEAAKKVKLQTIESKAKDLLTEYEEIDSQEQISLDDE